MSESVELKKSKRKIKKPEIIYEQGIHSIILFYCISFNLLIFYYCLGLSRIPFGLTIFLSIISISVSYYNYYNRKIVITRNKFYVYRLGKKTISLSFAKDFLHIKYEKTKLGKLLNYGSILLVTQDNQFYKVHFVKEPEQVFFASVSEYENVMQILNPDYEKQLNKEDSILNTIKKAEEFEKIES